MDFPYVLSHPQQHFVKADPRQMQKMLNELYVPWIRVQGFPKP